MTTTVADLFTRPSAATGTLDATADRVLDATLEEVALVGVARVTVEDVVRRSGVSRMTLYRRYPKRDDLLDALAERETARFLAAVSAAIDDAARGPDDGVVAAFVAAVTYARAHPVLRRVGDVDPGGFTASIAADHAAVLRTGRDFVAAAIHGGARGRPSEQVRWVADVCARLFVSYVAMPPDLDDAALRRLARDVLTPMVERATR